MNGLRVTLFCTSVLVALPGVATAQDIGGELSVFAGSMNYSNRVGNATYEINDASPMAYAYAGRLGFKSGALGGQIDFHHSSNDIDPTMFSGYQYGEYGAIHLNYEVSPMVTVGLFGGGGTADGAGTSGWRKASLEFYGAEALVSLPKADIQVQVGALDATDSESSDAFHDVTFASATANYDLTGNSRIIGSLFYGTGKQDSGAQYDMNGTTLSLAYERDLGALPGASWQVGYRYGHFTNGSAGDNGEFTEGMVFAGFTMRFGANASGKDVTPFDLPDFGRIANTGTLVD